MKYMLNKSTLTIVAILLLAFGLRFYNLENNPPGLTPDEAALGYNAYSILKTARDEHGSFLPVIFESFGDYKPGLYVYLTVPFVFLFGLVEVAVRLPSVLAGTFSVLFLYLLVKKLFTPKIALVAALLMALNPWSVHFSRGAWEVNMALTLTMLAVYLFFRGLENAKFMPFSGATFGLTLWTYQGAKLISMLLLISLLALNYRQIIKIKVGYLFISLIISLIFVLPIATSFFNGQAGRLSVFSVFSYPRPVEYRDAFLSEANIKASSPTYYLFYSESLNFLRGILGRYTNHYSTEFLFFKGDWQNPKHSPPYHGLLLYASLATIPIGLFYLLRRLDKNRTFVLLWLLLAPLPAALSRDQVHAVRSLFLLVPLVILAALGVESLWERFKTKASVLLAFSYLLSFILFIDAEFVHLPKVQVSQWGNYKEVALQLKKLSANYSTVIVQQSYNQPYIYYLFYSQYNPALYQKVSSFKESGGHDVGLIERIDNIKFQELNWGEIYRAENAVLIVEADTVPKEKIESTPELGLINQIAYKDGGPAFYVLEIR